MIHQFVAKGWSILSILLLLANLIHIPFTLTNDKRTHSLSFNLSIYQNTAFFVGDLIIHQRVLQRTWWKLGGFWGSYVHWISLNILFHNYDGQLSLCDILESSSVFVTVKNVTHVSQFCNNHLKSMSPL